MTTKTTIRRNAVQLVIGLLVLAAGATRADAAGPKRLGVLTFRGPGEATTRNAVAKAAKNNRFQVVGGQQISKTAAKLGVTLDANEAFKAVAKELGISAFVTGEVTSRKATLTVRDGADGSVTAEAGWSGRNPRGLSVAVSKNFWRRLGAAIERGKPPSGSKQAALAADDESAAGTDETEPPPSGPKSSAASKKAAAAATAEESEAPPPASESRSKKKRKGSDDEGAEGGDVAVAKKAEPEEEEETGPRPEALDVSIGPRVMTRSLTYNQDIYSRNSRYSLPAGPAIAIGADFYPAALSMGGFLANVGITADVSYLIPVVTTPAPAPSTGNYGTSSLSWSVGLKVRLPYGLFVSGSYGDQRYSLKPKGAASGIDVPAVEYKFVRGEAGIRRNLTPEITLNADVGYLQCLSLGAIGADPYYKNAKGMGIEAGLAIGYRINRTFEARVGADIRRYGLAFHQNAADFPATVNTDPTIRIAGGATDQYITGFVALAMLMGGGEPESEAAASKTHAAPDEEAEPGKSDEPAADSSADEKPAKKKSKAKDKDDD